MIPLLMPPLSGLQILVTRPTLQAAGLCARIIELGGTAITLPALAIQARDVTPPAERFDLLIFISSNAVEHGIAILKTQPQARIAAVGAATTHALQSLDYAVDVAPERSANSEALLAHPLLQSPPPHILIVRGVGGRELLRDALLARGSQVEVAEVYERIPLTPDPEQYQAVKTLLHAGELDVISVTSIEILQALDAMLDADTKSSARQCVLLAGSTRIAAAARQLGWIGEHIIADSPEDAAMMTALTRWHTRGRS